jgi:arsenate reductase (thioredoxin)
MRRAAMTASTSGISRPTVLFVGVRDAGRSQMAAAFLSQLADGTVHARSAGTLPAGQLDAAVVDAMAEEGVDLSAAQPTQVTTEALNAAQMVVTLGSRDECPEIPGRRYEDWGVEDPAGKDLAAVRSVRDDIKHRVQQLMSELQPALHPDAQ